VHLPSGKTKTGTLKAVSEVQFVAASHPSRTSARPPAFVTHIIIPKLCFAITSTRTRTEEREPLQSTKGHIPFLRLIQQHTHTLSLSFIPIRSSSVSSIATASDVRSCPEGRKINITSRSKEGTIAVMLAPSAGPTCVNLSNVLFGHVDEWGCGERERQRERLPRSCVKAKSRLACMRACVACGRGQRVGHAR
jgi:hypothetical protein